LLKHYKFSIGLFSLLFLVIGSTFAYQEIFAAQSDSVVFVFPGTQTAYKSGDAGTLRVTDAARNTDSGTKQSFFVDLSSSDDAGGIDIEVTETEINSGVFEGPFIMTTTGQSEGITIRVSDGGTVTGEGAEDAISTTADVDDTAPTFTADRTGDNTIVLTFSENVDTTTTDGSGYAVTSSVTANTDPAGSSVTMTLTTSGITATDATPTVTYTQAAGTTVDSAANEVANNESAVATDSVPPTVLRVDSDKANAAYKAGVAIDIDVDFSEDIVITGTPQITLETGTTDFVVDLAVGATDELTGTYTVQATDTSSDLDYKATTSLTGTIKDAAGNDATLTLATPAAANSLGANKDIVIDTTPPTILAVSLSATGTTCSTFCGAGEDVNIDVQYSETVFVDTAGTPTLSLNSGGTATVDVTSDEDDTLLFEYQVAGGENSASASTFLDYTTTTVTVPGGDNIRDEAGNSASSATLPTIGTSTLAATDQVLIDTTVPTIIAEPADKAVEANPQDAALTSVTYAPAFSVSDNLDASLDINCEDDGATALNNAVDDFAKGVTPVSCDVVDDAGNTTPATGFTIRVQEVVITDICVIDTTPANCNAVDPDGAPDKVVNAKWQEGDDVTDGTADVFIKGTAWAFDAANLTVDWGTIDMDTDTIVQAAGKFGETGDEDVGATFTSLVHNYVKASSDNTETITVTFPGSTITSNLNAMIAVQKHVTTVETTVDTDFAAGAKFDHIINVTSTLIDNSASNVGVINKLLNYTDDGVAEDAIEEQQQTTGAGGSTGEVTLQSGPASSSDGDVDDDNIHTEFEEDQFYLGDTHDHDSTTRH